jgi:hypothetical protein
VVSELSKPGKNETIKNEIKTDFSKFEGNEESLVVTILLDPNEDISCDIQWPKDEKEDDDITPNLNVTGEQRSKDYKVTATYTNHEGWTFGWKIKKAEDSKDSKIVVGEEEKDNNNIGVANDGTETSSPNKKVIIQKRFTEDYKICGTLTKDKHPKSPIEDCDDILKLKSSAVDDKKKVPTPYYPGPPQPQAPPPIRGSSDTSARGIR